MRAAAWLASRCWRLHSDQVRTPPPIGRLGSWLYDQRWRRPRQCRPGLRPGQLPVRRV